MAEDLPLAAEFPAVTHAQWRALVEAALKGADFDKRLVSRTYDGLRVQPLYERAAGAPVVAGRAAEPWQVVQRIDHPDPKAANAQALDELENGATGLSLVFAGAPAARGFGVAADSLAALDAALAGVMLDIVSLRLETAPFAGKPVAALIGALVDKRKLDPATLAIDFGLDPLGDMARTGRALLPWPELSARAGGTAADLKAQGFAKARFLRADGRAVHEASGTEAQEIAFVAAAGVAYLRLLEASGFTLDEARRRISFLMASGADLFVTLAKYRALRKLWARVEAGMWACPAAGLCRVRDGVAHDDDARRSREHAAHHHRGDRRRPRRRRRHHRPALHSGDRTARPAGAARGAQHAIGPVGRVQSLSRGRSGRRLRRHRGADDASSRRSAWKLLQEIEAAGGAAAALAQGLLQNKLAETRAARAANIARRKDALTGVSDYANLAEVPVKVLDVARARAAGAADGIRPAAQHARSGAVRSLARRLRPHARSDRQPAASVPGQSRPHGRFHRARELRQELLRGRRHRGGEQ